MKNTLIIIITTANFQKDLNKTVRRDAHTKYNVASEMQKSDGVHKLKNTMKIMQTIHDQRRKHVLESYSFWYMYIYM